MPGVQTPESSGTRPKFRVQNENGVTGGRNDTTRPPLGTGVRQQKPQKTSQPRMDNMPKPRLIGEGIADPSVTPEEMADNILLEDHLDFQGGMIEEHVESIAEQLGMTVETTKLLLAENEELVGQMLYQQGLEYSQDNLARSHDGDFDARYDDELTNLGKDQRALRGSKSQDEAMRLLRETVAQNQSPLMFAPLWPPLDAEGYQSPPVNVLKTSIPPRLRGRTSTGKKWSLRPPPAAKFLPKPTVACDLSNCAKMVWTRKQLLIHYRYRHKDEWETAMEERKLELAESQARDSKEERAESLKLLRRQNAIAELQLQDMLSKRELGEDNRERLEALGLLTPARERELAEAEAGG